MILRVPASLLYSANHILSFISKVVFKSNFLIIILIIVNMHVKQFTVTVSKLNLAGQGGGEADVSPPKE